MNTNILQYLEQSVSRVPEKCALLDDRVSYTYRQLDEARRRIGTALCGLAPQGSPVGIYMDKCADAVTVFFGIVSADRGDHLNYYGACKVTDFFTELLTEKNRFPDKRSDPAYADWNRCLDEFQKNLPQ